MIKQHLQLHCSVLCGKNRPPDHFLPISADKVKVLVFRCLTNLSHSGEGWVEKQVITKLYPFKIQSIIPAADNEGG